MGPDRTVVVADRVVAAMDDASVRMPQPVNISGESSCSATLRRLVLVDDAGPQAVAHVRRQGVDAALVGSRPMANQPASSSQKSRLNRVLSVGGLAAVALEAVVVAGLAGRSGRGRDRRRRCSPAPRPARSAARPSRPSANRIAVPTSPSTPGSAGPRSVRPLVLDVAVAVAVAVVLDPVQGPVGVRAAGRRPTSGASPQRRSSPSSITNSGVASALP